MLARCITAIGFLLFAGCSHDPLARASVYPGLVRVQAPEGELVPILFSASGTPAKQGLLYVAMQDAAVAGQNASLARGAATVEEVRTRAGEVLYALDPAIAPAWPAKSSGIVEIWAGSGYGLRRSVPRIIEEIQAALDRGGASEALRTYGPRAIRCAENTLGRADRVQALAEQALVATDAELKPILRELDEVATALNNGVPAPGEEGCGLQQTHLYLNQIGPYSPGYEGA
jgi:hypothetical protein